MPCGAMVTERPTAAGTCIRCWAWARWGTASATMNAMRHALSISVRPSERLLELLTTCPTLCKVFFRLPQRRDDMRQVVAFQREPDAEPAFRSDNEEITVGKLIISNYIHLLWSARAEGKTSVVAGRGV